MKIMKTTALMLGAAILTAGAVAAPAEAATVRTFSCSKSGFTGWLIVKGTKNNVDLYYRIDKGGNRGGNKADVSTRDGGVAPSRTYVTRYGIQDNREHFFASYRRGGGGFSVTFVFDKLLAFDPACGTGGSF